MTAESDSNHSKGPKDRREVNQQEQQRIVEEAHQVGSGKPRGPKDRREVNQQEQQRIVEEAHQAES